MEIARREAEAARIEAVQREAERQRTARLAAEQLEAQRRELARQEAEALRVKAAQREAERARLAAEQLEAQRQEAARLAPAQQAAAPSPAEQEEAKRQERLRAIGRQLDEEAARRDEAAAPGRPPSTLPLSLSTARRARLFGRTDPNAELVRYAEAWAQKIQFNTPVETVRDVAAKLRINPMVTVAIRSNGAVESVTFLVSSGSAEVDEAIRRIVRSHEHYQAFPPALARDYDVIEIRRTWYFDVAIRLY
jgi:outer membrane biosynthesis protein TonB